MAECLKLGRESVVLWLMNILSHVVKAGGGSRCVCHKYHTMQHCYMKPPLVCSDADTLSEVQSAHTTLVAAVGL